MAWNTSDLALLNTYRVSHNLTTSAAFTSPYNQALLSNPGIGRQSPTMARKKDKRRVSKDQLATSVRKHFNGAAVSEMEVITELVYKVRNQGKSCAEHRRQRSRSLSEEGDGLMLGYRQSFPDAICSHRCYEEVMRAGSDMKVIERRAQRTQYLVSRRSGYMHYGTVHTVQPLDI